MCLFKDLMQESTFKMKTGDEAAIKATSSRPSSPDKQASDSVYGLHGNHHVLVKRWS